MWRIMSPLSPEGTGWLEVLKCALIPWEYAPGRQASDEEDTALQDWKSDWQFAIEVSFFSSTVDRALTLQTLLNHDRVKRHLDRLTSLTTDVRILFKPFVSLSLRHFETGDS